MCTGVACSPTRRLVLMVIGVQPMPTPRSACLALAAALFLLQTPSWAEAPAPGAAPAPAPGAAPTSAPRAAPASAPRAAPASAPGAAPASVSAPGAAPELRELVKLARERAPEVALGRSALTASRSSYASARLAPIGNPFLEVKFQGATKDVVKDVNIDSALWLPIEIAGQKSRRGREADDYVQLHEALLEQARALASSRTVRAYGALVVGATRFHVLTELATVAQAEARYYADRMALGDATERDAALSAV